MELAELSIEEGQPQRAEAAVRQVAQQFLGDDQQADPAALELLARSLLAQGKRADAQKAIARASALLWKNQRRDTQFAVGITAARVSSASGNAADAARASETLQRIIADANQHGYRVYELEARLALGEMEIKSGSTAPGPAHARHPAA